MTCHFDSLDTRRDSLPPRLSCAGTVIALPVTFANAKRTGGVMHELTLCQRAVEIIEQQAQQRGARKVTGVWLEIGAFSCVERSALEFCFDLACRDTRAEGCTLHLSQQEAKCWCPQCQRNVQLLTTLVRRCPHCHSADLRIDADDSVQIKRLEIEQE